MFGSSIPRRIRTAAYTMEYLFSLGPVFSPSLNLPSAYVYVAL